VSDDSQDSGLGDLTDLEATEPIGDDSAASVDTEPAKSSKLVTARTWAIDLLAGGVIAALVVLGYNWWNDRDDDSSEVDLRQTPPSFTLPGTPSPTAPLPDGCTAEAPEQQGNDKQYEQPRDAVLDPTKTYTAIITTSCGVIEVDLDVENAPISASNFVFLAREGFFDGLSWHRAVSNFVIQGGDPTGTGSGGPGYSVVGEIPGAYETGTVAWAKAGADPAGTEGSQFFITTGDPAALNASCDDGECDYGIIGTVTKGLDNAQKIESLSPGDGPPTTPLYIVSVVIAES
jgi:cyclophilin family peptidyl-prolyl cis-trans isomerase